MGKNLINWNLKDSQGLGKFDDDGPAFLQSKHEGKQVPLNMI